MLTRFVTEKKKENKENKTITKIVKYKSLKNSVQKIPYMVIV